MVGCGPAGLLAALESRRKGCTVIAVDKGLIGHECSAVGAKQLAATGPWSKDGDAPEIHYRDTLVSGCHINNPELVRLLTERIGRVVSELHELGMPLERNKKGDGIAIDGPAPGHSKARSLYFSDITGRLLVKTILAQCRRFGVEFYSEHIVVEVITNQDGVCGALVYDLLAGEFVCIRTKAIIIASGGLGCLYELTSNPVQTTGDGIALAFRAGAELMDMEFVQFYPVTVLFPKIIRGMNLNSQHIGAHLVNSLGERFMSKYYPEELEHVTRDKLSQSIFKEITEGNTGPHGGVFMDATMVPAQVYAQKIPTEWDLANKAGIDLTSQPLEVAPSAHYFMGGIRIDPCCRATVKGLFAAGECTAGTQGANRLANNGLSEALAFGSLAGENAAKYALKERLSELEPNTTRRKLENLKAMFADNGESPSKLVMQLRQIMSKNVGVVRNKQGLKVAIENLRAMKKYKYCTSLGIPWSRKTLEALNLRNMVLVAEIIANAALIRTESRGAHYRSDYPERNDSQWLSNLVVKSNSNGTLEIKRENVGSRGCTDW